MPQIYLRYHGLENSLSDHGHITNIFVILKKPGVPCQSLYIEIVSVMKVSSEKPKTLKWLPLFNMFEENFHNAITQITVCGIKIISMVISWSPSLKTVMLINIDICMRFTKNNIYC